jgi:hypothetical protein
MKVSPCLATAMCFRGQSRFGVFFSQEKTLAKSRILDAANPAKGGMRSSGRIACASGARILEAWMLAPSDAARQGKAFIPLQESKKGRSL